MLVLGYSVKGSFSQGVCLAAPLAALDRSEVACTLSRPLHTHTGNGGHGWCLSSSPSWSVGVLV